jgi:hypothetical protein
MMRSVLLLLAVPLGSAVAQSSAVHLSVTSANQTAFRIAKLGRDSVERPLIARGRLDLVAESSAARGGGTFQGIELTALDTTTAIHVEATQNGRVIASGEGVYLKVHRDTTGIAIEARSSVPVAIARTLRKPD